MDKTTFIYTSEDSSNASIKKSSITSENGKITIDSYPVLVNSNTTNISIPKGVHIVTTDSSIDSILINERQIEFESNSATPNVIKALNTNNASFAVLETNPKLTGNIKVVIDSNENIFIDTFKVNDTLSKKKYRKVPVSYKDYYGKNLMSIFRNITSDVLYNIPKKYYDIVTTTTNLSEQFVDIYRCGVSTNKDNLYKENFSMLAPIYIKDILPDFFVIFKVKGLVNLTNSTDIMKYLIKNGEQLKCFDFRLNTKLGTYIRNIQKNANKFGSELYVSKNVNNSHQLTGISIEKGVVANVYENLNNNSNYAKYEENDASINIKNVVYLNHFSTLFESNKLVSDRLINFEFMFDDNTDDVEQFELNTYYGLYLYSNVLTSSVYPCSIDENGYHFKDINSKDTTLSSALDTINNKEELIYGYTSDDWFRRITENNKNTILSDIINKPGDNVLYTYGKKIDNTKYKSFFTFTLTKPFKAGEHLKIIFNSQKALKYNTIIYEIIFSDDDIYKNSILSGKNITYNTDYKTESHRISCYVKENETISEQITHIYKALKEVKDDILEITSKTSDSISLCQIDNEEFEAYFQHISNSNSIENANKLRYFGNYEPKIFILDPLKEMEDSNDCFLPIDFELAGEMATSICQFISIPSNKTAFEISKNSYIDNNNLLNRLFITVNKDNTVKELEQFQIINKTLENDKIVDEQSNVNIINSFNNNSNNILLLDNTQVKQSDEIEIYLYKPYYINYVLCGLLNVKQLDAAPEKEEFETYNGDLLSKFQTGITTNYCNISPLVSSKFNWVANGNIDSNTQLKLSIDSSTNKSVNLYDNTTDSFYSQINYRNDILNNNITISDFVYVISNKLRILPIKTYIINNNTVEFLYNNAKYQLTTNNTEIISGKELSNCNIYIYNSINYSNENEWEIFIDKQNKDILLIHYIYTYSIDSSIKDICTTEDKKYYIKKFNIKEELNDILITNDNKCTVTPLKLSNDLSFNTSTYIILFSKYITISGLCDSKNGDKITIKDIKITSNYYENDNSNNILSDGSNNLLNKYNHNTQFIGYSIDNNPEASQNIDNADNNSIDDITSNSGIYIKYDKAFNAFTTLSPLALNIVNTSDVNLQQPTETEQADDASIYYTYQTVYEPYFYDLFEFSNINNNESISNISTSKYNNLILNDVKPIHNMWGIRYTKNTNYCIERSMGLYKNQNIEITKLYSYFTIKNYNTLQSSLLDFYRYFDSSITKVDIIKDNILNEKKKVNSITNTEDTSSSIKPIDPKLHIYVKYGGEETVNIIKGYKSGIIQKTYQNSLGLLFKNNSHNNIEISSWLNTFIKDECIYFNVSYNLLYLILHSNGFVKVWNQNNISDENDRINFIKSTIIPLISINTKNSISVYTKNTDTGKYSYSNSFISGMKENKNIKIELINENDILYVKLTPTKKENNIYYIKYNINL